MQNTSEVHEAYLHFAKHFESFKKKKKNWCVTTLQEDY